MSDVQTVLTGDDGAFAAEIASGEATALQLTDEQKSDLMGYLIGELEQVEGARTEMSERWKIWRRHRMMEPENRTKNEPFENSSNLVPPKASSNMNGIYAHLKAAFERRKPLASAISKKNTFKQHAASWQRYLNCLLNSPFEINFNKPLKEILSEGSTMGTQIVEVPWVNKIQRFKRQNTTGDGLEMVEKTVYKGPMARLVRLEDFYCRVEMAELQDAPWLAVVYRDRPEHVLREQEALGFFEGIDDISTKQQFAEFEEENAERMGLELQPASNTNIYDIWKAWVRYDADGDGLAEDIIVWFERDSEKIIRAEINDLGWRMISAIKYLPISNYIYAMGVGWLGEYAQEEITTLHNMRIDSLHLHSQQLLAVKRGSGFGKKEKLRPGRTFEFDDPSRDVTAITFPDVSQPTMLAEQMISREMDVSVGMSEARMGMPDTVAKSGTSPQLQMFLDQKGNTIMESAVESMAEGISEVLMFFTLQLVKNSDLIRDEVQYYLDDEDVGYVQEILDMEPEQIPDELYFQVKTTDVERSEEAQRQHMLAIDQMYNMFFQQVMQAQQVVGQEQLPEEMRTVAMQYIVGKSKIMEKMVELLGDQDANDYVPYYGHLELMNDFIRQQKAMMVEAQSGQMATGSSGARNVGGGPQGTPGYVGGVLGASETVPEAGGVSSEGQVG